MRRFIRGAAVMTVLLAAGCGTTSNSTQPARSAQAAQSAQSAQHAQAPRPSSSASASAGLGQTCAPGAVGPESASFISASDGWLLGVTLQDCWPSNSARIVLRKTTDGGRHWAPSPAPPAPWSGGSSVAPGSVNEAYFADPRDGWVFGPGLWSTHDAGATWHRVDTGSRAVYRMAATDGHVVAVFLGCGTACAGDRLASFAIETSPAGSDGWRAIAGAMGSGQPDLIAAAGAAYAVGANGAGDAAPGRLLTGPADGAAPWRARVTPCPAFGASTGTALTATSLVVACALLGAHPATTRLYRSDDSGAHWRQFSHLGLYDGASAVSVAAGGMLLVGGNFDSAELSRDGGRTWQRLTATSASPQAGCCALDVAMTSDEDGFVLAVQGPLWITSDGGRTWVPVTVR